MIYLNDIIKIITPKGKKLTKYRATCDKCGKDRGYLSKQNASKPFCVSCARNITDASRRKMSEAKRGKTPWNKGRKETREHVLEKLSRAKIGKAPYNKGHKLSYEQRVKLSCAARGIELPEFDEIRTPKEKAERDKFNELKLHILCFERHDYTCDACGARGVLLNAHHKNSWKFFPEYRFDVSNLVALCKKCHDKFHEIYGSGKTTPNTEAQYQEFKKSMSKNKNPAEKEEDSGAKKM